MAGFFKIIYDGVTEIRTSGKEIAESRKQAIPEEATTSINIKDNVIIYLD